MKIETVRVVLILLYVVVGEYVVSVILVPLISRIGAVSDRDSVRRRAYALVAGSARAIVRLFTNLGGQKGYFWPGTLALDTLPPSR